MKIKPAKSNKLTVAIPHILIGLACNVDYFEHSVSLHLPRVHLKLSRFCKFRHKPKIK